MYCSIVFVIQSRITKIYKAVKSQQSKMLSRNLNFEERKITLINTSHDQEKINTNDVNRTQHICIACKYVIKKN